MPGRKYLASGASKPRYGFNGKENDNEVSGDGNQYDYGFRIYNPRLGRFLSVDPLSKSYPWYTPYQFAGNKPIIAIDLDGLEEYFVFTRLNNDGGKTVTIEYVTDKKVKGAVNLHYKQVLSRGVDGGVDKTGADLTTSKVARKTIDANGREVSTSFSNNLTPLELRVMGSTNSSSDLFAGPSNGEVWEVSIGSGSKKGDYVSSVDRKKTSIENIAEMDFGHPALNTKHLSGAPLVTVSDKSDNGDIMWGISANGNDNYFKQLNSYLKEVRTDGTIGSMDININYDIAVPKDGSTGDMSTYINAARNKIISQIKSYVNDRVNIGANNINVNLNITKRDLDAPNKTTTTDIKLNKLQ